MTIVASGTATTGTTVRLGIDPRDEQHPISPTLFGLFFEDLNYGLDGGLTANLVNNHSFEGVYFDRKLHNFLVAISTKRKPRRVVDRTRHWRVLDGHIRVLGPENTHRDHFARVTASGGTRILNDGFAGDGPSMGAREGVALDLRLRLRTTAYTGDVVARLVDAAGREIASAALAVEPGTDWGVVSARLVPTSTSLVSLELRLDGTGDLDMDEVFLIPEDHWGAGDPRWSQGVLRRDLVEAIRDVNPTFLRFPGGCIVEGLAVDNAYSWKKTIGPIDTRQGDYNTWALSTPNGDYTQSHQIGYYEYFLLCEDLGMKPIPVLFAGLACQSKSKELVDLDGPAFAEVVQDAVDLLDWATGDPKTNEWAAFRAAAGHPEPFEIDTLAIGNENHGPEYFSRFKRIADALLARRPDLTLIISASSMPDGEPFEQTWEYVRKHPEGLIVDEHFYKSVDWFKDAVRRYDNYDRAGAKVFSGEYAAFTPTIVTPKALRPAANTFASALGEAAYYTGLIRNSDLVTMSAYAPLLNLVEHGQWQHNFIDFNPFTVQPTVNYLVQQLFSGTVGEVLLPVTGELPDGVFAVATKTGSEVTVHAVNTGDAPSTLQLEVATQTTGAATLRTLHEDPKFRFDLRFGDQAARAWEPRGEALVVTDRQVMVPLGAKSIAVLSLTVVD